MASETINPGTVHGFVSIANPQISALGWFNQADTVAVNPVGGKTRWGSIVLRYVKVDPTDVTPLAGAPMYASVFVPQGTSTAVPTLTVTADTEDSVLGSQVVGIYGPVTITLPTTAYYTWIQIGGVATVVSTGVTTAGMILTGALGSGSDSVFTVWADGSAPSNVPAARAFGTSSGGQITALLMNMDW